MNNDNLELWYQVVDLMLCYQHIDQDEDIMDKWTKALNEAKAEKNKLLLEEAEKEKAMLEKAKEGTGVKCENKGDSYSPVEPQGNQGDNKTKKNEMPSKAPANSPETKVKSTAERGSEKHAKDKPENEPHNNPKQTPGESSKTAPEGGSKDRPSRKPASSGKSRLFPLKPDTTNEPFHFAGEIPDFQFGGSDAKPFQFGAGQNKQAAQPKWRTEPPCWSPRITGPGEVKTSIHVNIKQKDWEAAWKRYTDEWAEVEACKPRNVRRQHIYPDI